jgi:hypothetical protein
MESEESILFIKIKCFVALAAVFVEVVLRYVRAHLAGAPARGVPRAALSMAE